MVLGIIIAVFNHHFALQACEIGAEYAQLFFECGTWLFIGISLFGGVALVTTREQ